jgi:Putative GTPase activating protein for Arf
MESSLRQQQQNEIKTSLNRSSSSSDYTTTKTIINEDDEMILLNRVSNEIERMRKASLLQQQQQPDGTATTTTTTSDKRCCYHSFPPACLEMLTNIKGNHRCVDCGEQNPQWAACKYGVLLCLNCSGHHRSLGVQISSVRSISMDEWSVNEVVSMLEGGNSQLIAFFDRHALTKQTCTSPTSSTNANDTIIKTATSSTINRENVTRLRYKTKAAMFYRIHMEKHVTNILHAGPYRGREISRQITQNNTIIEQPI